MARRTRIVASPTERRRHELQVQLRELKVAMSCDHGAPSYLRRLGPFVVTAANAELDKLNEIDGAPDRWAVLEHVERRTRVLSSEVLQFLGGSTCRELGLDRGACDRTDAMLGSLTSRLGLLHEFVTLPAESEYTGVVADIVRVRYPGRGAWDLPIALHEFGHFAASRLPRPRAASTIITARVPQRPANLASYAEELWCDVFATYIVGPAYGFAIATRLDPSRAHRDAPPSHPSPAKRVAVVLATLDHLQRAWSVRGRASGSQAEIRGRVDRLWRRRVRSAGAEPDGEPEQLAEAQDLARHFLSALDHDEWCRPIRFDDASAAIEIALELEQGREMPPGHFSIADVLVGGWIARRTAEEANDWYRKEVIDDAVLRACDTLLGVGALGGERES